MKRVLGAVLFLLLISSCDQNPKAASEVTLKSNMEIRNEMVAEIDSLETIFYADTFKMNTETGPALMQLYTDFAKMFVGDKEKTPEYLYKAAAMSRGVGLPMKAIKFYDQILMDYPNYSRCPEVAFLIGFTYDEDLKKPDLAKEAYNELISRFPDDYWAQQARYRLETVDMTDEELIEYFMKKNTEPKDG